MLRFAGIPLPPSPPLFFFYPIPHPYTYVQRSCLKAMYAQELISASLQVCLDATLLFPDHTQSYREIDPKDVQAVHIHRGTPAHAHTCMMHTITTHRQTDTDTHTHTHTHNVLICLHVLAHTYTNTHTCTHTCAQHMHACMHTEIHRQAGRQAHRQTGTYIHT